MSSLRLQTFSFLALFFGVSVLLFFIFAPFLQLLTLAGVFAALLQYPYKKLLKIFGNKTAAAMLVVGASILFLIVPLFSLGFQIFVEMQNYYSQNSVGTESVNSLQNAVNHSVHKIFPLLSFNLQQYINDTLTFVSRNVAGVLSGTAYIFLNTFLMLLAFFFFLRDGELFVAKAHALSPFGSTETDELLRRTYQTAEAVIKGTLLVALVRWLLLEVAFYFFGVPNALLWGTVGGFVGAIPGLGTLLVFVPAVLYMWLQGNTLSALGLSMSALGIILAVDNLLTSYFFGKKLPVPQMFILFSILGGIAFFGPIGFILGPLVLSLFISIVSIYTTKDSADIV